MVEYGQTSVFLVGRSWWDPGCILPVQKLLFFVCLSPVLKMPVLSAAAVFWRSPGVWL